MQLISIVEKLKRVKYFLTALLLLWVLTLGWWWMQGSANAFLKLRPQNDFGLDGFFQYFTHLGDGLFATAVIVVLLLMRKFGFAFVMLFGFAVSGLLAQLIKPMVNAPRPAPFFLQKNITIHAVDGVNLLQGNNSFPSGHTATAFAIATALMMMSTWWQKRWVIAWLLAVSIGYSRIYLGQHFLQDVWVGSVLGVASSLGGWWILEKWQPKFYRQP